jgi:hypothetical protein
MVGSGFGVAAQPEPHLVWSHVGYGLVLGMFGRLVGPNAHGFITIIAVWLALTPQIRASLAAPSTRTRFFVLVVGVGCVFTGELLSPEFTITVAVLFAGAIAGWLVSSDELAGSDLAEGSDSSRTNLQLPHPSRIVSNGIGHRLAGARDAFGEGQDSP